MRMRVLTVLLPVAVAILAAGCRTTPDDPASTAAQEVPQTASTPPDDREQQQALAERRRVAREADLLHKLIAIDRKSVQNAETALENAESLHRAGRVGTADLSAAQQRLLDSQRALLEHERQLAALENR